MKVSAVIIAFNEEAKIADAIRSVIWADEILVVDSESNDRTRAIAEALGARVIEKKWAGFADQKQFAVDNAAYDRVMSLDADERVSDSLKAEIADICRMDVVADGYKIPRLSTYMGREIRHSGWYPDRQLRFFDRRKAHWKRVAVHESIVMADGATTDNLRSPILHYSIDNPRHHAEMIQSRYAPLAADAMLAAGRRTSRLTIVFLPAITFLQTYFLKAGFLDGFAGICIAYFSAYNVFLKHLMLYEQQQSAGSKLHRAP